MNLFMHRNMLAAAWNNSWKLLAHYTTLGHAPRSALYSVRALLYEMG
jgi:hypothetical protein